VNAGPNLYAYVDSNPVAHIDPRGLLTSREALEHYKDGSSTPLRMPFADIDTSGVRPSSFEGVKDAVRSCKRGDGKCEAKALTIDGKKLFTTSGDQFLFLGDITLRLQGTLSVDCNCCWAFAGTLKSYDDKYDLNQSTHRGVFAEWLTGRGRQTEGAPYWIEIRGAKLVSERGCQ
jgi:hypothetical protein